MHPFDLAVILIALGAVVGLTMGVQHFEGPTPPQLGHGLRHAHIWALALFGLAALGGPHLVSHHLRQRPLPNGVIVIQGLVAIIAFLMLSTAAYLIP